MTTAASAAGKRQIAISAVDGKLVLDQGSIKVINL